MNDTAQFEYSLAAAVCLDPKRVLQLRQIVSVEDFSISACATVFGAADSAVSRGKAFDANIAADGLRGLVDDPRKFLAECIDVTPTVAHAENMPACYIPKPRKSGYAMGCLRRSMKRIRRQRLPNSVRHISLTMRADG